MKPRLGLEAALTVALALALYAVWPRAAVDTAPRRPNVASPSPSPAAVDTGPQGPKPSPEPPAAVPIDLPHLDVMFVLDTTGSMGGLLAAAKGRIWSIAAHLAAGTPRPVVRIGLVAYRDLTDAYIAKHLDLSENLDTVFTQLSSFEAEGGGDGPEHIGLALAEAVSRSSWSDSGRSLRLVFLVGDAPSHDYGDGVTTRVWAKEAEKRSVVINTIQCGTDPATTREFQMIAEIAHGSFMSTGAAGDVEVVETPYDEEVARLSRELRSYALVAGPEAAQREARTTLDAARALSPASEADRLSFRAKGAAGSSAEGAMDLLGTAHAGAIDLADNPAALARLSDAELPDALRRVPERDRAAFVQETARKKQATVEALLELTKKRDEWLSKNEPKTGFDAKLLEVVKAQASSIGMAY